MASHRTYDPGRGSRLRGAILVLAAALLTAAPAAAGMPAACRIPDAFLDTPALDRTESGILGRREVRIVIMGPMLGRMIGTQTPLEQALENRLPGINFEVTQAMSLGLAEDDFAGLRLLLHGRKAPDLVIWQVGVRDAMAASDVEDFEQTLDAAHGWLDARGADLLLVDPPFVEGVSHERIYTPYIGGIGEVSREEGVPMLRRYAAMRYLEGEADRRRLKSEILRPCVSELMAEAIVRAVGK